MLWLLYSAMVSLAILIGYGIYLGWQDDSPVYLGGLTPTKSNFDPDGPYDDSFESLHDPDYGALGPDEGY